MRAVTWFFVIGIVLSVVARIVWKLSTMQFIGLVAAVSVIVILLYAVVLECFKKIIINESNFSGFKYVYFETQGTYNQSAGLLTPKFEGMEEAIASNDANVKFIGMYFDHSSMIEDAEKMRVCWGVGFFSKEAEEKTKQGIATLVSRGAAVKELPAFKLVSGSIQFYFILSFIIAIKKIYPPLIEYLKVHYPAQYFSDNGVPFMHVPNMEDIQVGMPIGETAEKFRICSIAPPKRNQTWEQEKKAAKSKSD